MSTIKTNAIRFELGGHPVRFEIDLQCSHPINQLQRQEIEEYLYDKSPCILLSFPYLYSPVPLSTLRYSLFLSTGVQVVINLQEHTAEMESVLSVLAIRIMKELRFLYCRYTDSCFNPFEQLRELDDCTMGGFKLTPHWIDKSLGFYIIPLQLAYKNYHELTEQSNLLMDCTNGDFYQKEDVVRIDKKQNQIHFRNGSIATKSHLRSVRVNHPVGYPLVQKLFNTIDRLKMHCSLLFQAWGLKLDSRFQDCQYKAILPGSISFRGNVEKPLAQIVTPMSSYNYSYQYRSFFSKVSLDDILQMELILLIPESLTSFGHSLKRTLQEVKAQMQLLLSTRLVIYQEQTDDLLRILSSQVPNPLKMYIFVHGKHIKRDVIDKHLQFLINSQYYFHFVDYEPTETIFEVIAVKHLAIIYTKARINAWKLKNIPFGHQPLVVMTVHVATLPNKAYSVAVVSSMNVFLSKFTSAFKHCTADTLQQTIQACTQECLMKFKSAHDRFPIRTIIFRDGQSLEPMTSEYSKVKQQIQISTNSVVTYITLTKEHNLRTYTQIDANLVTYETVKRVQLLLSITHQKETYLQLEMDEPMHRVTIYDVEPADPHFSDKMLELIAKMVFGGVGNAYGRGLGFLQYAQKLNSYRHLDLEAWRGLLKDGVLLFL